MIQRAEEITLCSTKHTFNNRFLRWTSEVGSLCGMPPAHKHFYQIPVHLGLAYE
ncbi:hypothetical protein HanIR_Chr16g0839221 [Helianthus annuus]|nr:hypothetical protein HanIR_Chr16g0839221 [Helianthus annuus]